MISINKKTLLAFYAILSTTILHAQPRATVAEPVKDLGNFFQDQLIVYDFIVKNEGNATLQIIDVKPACGCTVAEYDKTIEPGKTGKVHAKVDISKFSGVIAKGITVMTNDTDNPQIELTIRAVVKPLIDIMPGYVRFNVLQGEVDNAKDVEIISSGDGKPFDVLSATTSSPGLNVSFREATASERVPEFTGKQWAVELTLNDNIKIGPLAENAVLTTNHPRQKEVKIPVFGVVRPPFRLEPTTLNFGEVAADDKRGYLAKVVTVRGNSLTNTFTVSRAETNVKGISVQLKATPNKNEYEMTVTVDPSLVKGDFTGTLAFYTDNKMKPRVEVPLQGTIKAAGN